MMNKIEQLLQQYCPDGVEFKSLGEDNVANITIGEFVHKSKQNPDGEYPVYNGGISETGFYDEFNNTGEKIIISARGANAGYVNKIYKPYWAGNSCYTIDIINKSRIDWVFVFYYLKNNQNKLIGEQQKGGIPAVSKKQIENFQIPIPPIEIQQEIVKILDTFTELEARKKQYEYYRDDLLSFGDDEVEWKEIDELCDVFTGGEAPENAIKGEIPTENLKYPIFGNGSEIYGFTDTYRIDKDAVTISSIGANTGTIYFRKAFFTPIIRLKVVIPKNENLLSRYLFYYLSSVKIYSKKSSVPNMNADDVKKIKIPVSYKNGQPDLEKQQEIVSILDTFDALVNDISIGLPAEIAARRQQYEHYRGKLLTFQIYEG